MHVYVQLQSRSEKATSLAGETDRRTWELATLVDLAYFIGTEWRKKVCV